MTRLRLVALIAFLLLLIAQSPLAQDKSPQPPVFRTSVDLATLDVTVVDKDGRPIPGLKPEDFAVTLNGQARPVRALDFIETAAVSSARKDSAPAATTTPGAPSPRTVLILFDDLSYKPGSGRGLIQAGLRLLPSFGANDVIGLATTSGLGPKVNPTRDHAAIAAALQNKTLVGRNTDNSEPFYIGLDEALEIERDAQKQTLSDVVARECPIVMPLEPKNGPPPIPPKFDPNGPCPNLVEGAARAFAHATINRTDDQLAAYMAAIAALKAAPAPRVIVTLTAGLALSNEHGDVQRQMEAVKHAASDAGVDFYAISEVPDDADPMSPERSRARRTEGRFLDDGIQTVSATAGGETFRVVGTADRFFARILTETSAFYRLGIELPDAQPSRRFLSAKVTVARPGVVVRTHAEAIVAAVAAVAAGTVTKPVVAAHRVRIGTYSSSGVLTTWTDSAGALHPLALDTLPQEAAKLRVALELYPDDPAARDTSVSVRLSLMSLSAVGEPSPVATQTFVPLRNGPALRIAADIPASAVPDGIYVIHAEVLKDGNSVGEVSSSIQKLPASPRPTAASVVDYAAWVRGGARSGFDLNVADLDALREHLAALKPTQLPMRRGATPDETRESERRLVTSYALEAAAVGAKRNTPAAERLIEWACGYVRSHTPVGDFDRAWELAALAALEGAIDSGGLRAHLGHLPGALAGDPRVQLAHGLADEQFNAPPDALSRSLAAIDLARSPQDASRTDADAGRAIERAIARYQDALNTPAIHAEAALRLGHVYLMAHRYDEALTAWKDAGKSPDDDPALVYLARLFRGLSYEGLKRDDDARAAYQSAAELSPSAHSVNMRLAILAYRSGRTQESQAIIERLLKQDDPRSDPWWSYYAGDWRFWYARIGQVRSLVQ